MKWTNEWLWKKSLIFEERVPGSIGTYIDFSPFLAGFARSGCQKHHITSCHSNWAPIFMQVTRKHVFEAHSDRSNGHLIWDGRLDHAWSSVSLGRQTVRFINMVEEDWTTSQHVTKRTINWCQIEDAVGCDSSRLPGVDKLMALTRSKFWWANG